jgi:hypothetical protein
MTTLQTIITPNTAVYSLPESVAAAQNYSPVAVVQVDKTHHPVLAPILLPGLALVSLLPSLDASAVRTAAHKAVRGPVQQRRN